MDERTTRIKTQRPSAVGRGMPDRIFTLVHLAFPRRYIYRSQGDSARRAHSARLSGVCAPMPRGSNQIRPRAAGNRFTPRVARQAARRTESAGQVDSPPSDVELRTRVRRKLRRERLTRATVRTRRTWRAKFDFRGCTLARTTLVGAYTRASVLARTPSRMQPERK